MRILFPVSGVSGDVMLDDDLHSAEYFCVYSMENSNASFFLKERITEMGISVFSFMNQHRIKAVISKKIHFLALKVLADHGIDSFVAGAEGVDENIVLLRQGKLKRFGAENAAVDGCSSHCQDCSSSCSSKKEAACQ